MMKKTNIAIISVLAAAVAPSAVAETLEVTGELMTSTCVVGSTGGTISVAMGCRGREARGRHSLARCLPWTPVAG